MRIILFISILFLSLPSFAQEASEAFRSTDYPLPRFVSLRSNEVYVRTGPGQKYPVEWIFKQKGIPVEITLEYDVWRKIKDFDGAQGWVHKSLLSGKRTGFIRSDEKVTIHQKPKESSTIQAYLQPKVLLEIDGCAAGWCAIDAAGYKGWLKQTSLWGVYEDEEFD